MNEILEAIEARLIQYLDRFESMPDSSSGEELVKCWKPVEEMQEMLAELWEKFDKKFLPIKKKQWAIPAGDYQCKLVSIGFDENVGIYQIEIIKGKFCGVVLKGKIYARR